MRTAPFACLAFALLGLFGRPAAATEIALSIPLVSSDSDTPTVADATLSGTLSYDNDAQTGSGTFTVGGDTDTFSGFAFSLAAGSSLGVVFSGDNADDTASLYFDLDLSPGPGSTWTADAPGSVMLSALGNDADYTALVGSPGLGSGSGSGSASDTPGSGLSPVPLPPAGGLFGGALLLLATLSPRLRPRAAAPSGDTAA